MVEDTSVLLQNIATKSPTMNTINWLENILCSRTCQLIHFYFLLVSHKTGHTAGVAISQQMRDLSFGSAKKIIYAS